MKGLRIAFGGAPFFDNVDAEVEAAVRETGKVFEALGAQVGTIDILEVRQFFSDLEFCAVVLGDAVAINRDLLENHAEKLDPLVRDLLERGQGLSAATHAGRMNKLATAQAGMALRVARAYEQETDWHTRRPDLDWAG